MMMIARVECINKSINNTEKNINISEGRNNGFGFYTSFHEIEIVILVSLLLTLPRFSLHVGDVICMQLLKETKMPGKIKACRIHEAYVTTASLSEGERRQYT